MAANCRADLQCNDISNALLNLRHCFLLHCFSANLSPLSASIWVIPPLLKFWVFSFFELRSGLWPERLLFDNFPVVVSIGNDHFLSNSSVVAFGLGKPRWSRFSRSSGFPPMSYFLGAHLRRDHWVSA
ncbi:hypothetical protein E2542_SST23883 [Spatholobus suberectus]|nr:hypothetical protein E2542_SST23883 [Spatholobus suberectus]